MARVHRQTVDLSAYPDLVVIYLGMQVYSVRGLSLSDNSCCRFRG